ncbi:MAG TPA: hypothetical protein VJR95_07395 [Rhodanobacter sp.]|nr:hypothetical protein [Rhodanobacter sp.]
MTLAVALVVALPTTGCTSGAGDPSQAESSSGKAGSDAPPIHVEQTIVFLKDGVPAVEANYREALAKCSAGPLPVQPLSPDVVGKLGRTRLDIRYEGARMAVNADHWDFKSVEHPPTIGCAFGVVHTSRLTIVKPGASIGIDLVKRVGSSEASAGAVRSVVPAATPSGGDDKLQVAVAAELAKQGQGDLMGQDAGSGTSAGQPCKRGRSTFGEFCVWSGGQQWGFVTDKAETNDRMDAPTDSITLWSKPADGNGYELTTQSMTVGTPIDGKVFEVPSGIAISKAN